MFNGFSMSAFQAECKGSIPFTRTEERMKSRRLYKYISEHDAKILEELYVKWKPSVGYEKLFESLRSLETDLAKRVGWSEYKYYIAEAPYSMISWLMEEEK